MAPGGSCISPCEPITLSCWFNLSFNIGTKKDWNSMRGFHAVQSPYMALRSTTELCIPRTGTKKSYVFGTQLVLLSFLCHAECISHYRTVIICFACSEAQQELSESNGFDWADDNHAIVKALSPHGWSLSLGVPGLGSRVRITGIRTHEKQRMRD